MSIFLLCILLLISRSGCESFTTNSNSKSGGTQKNAGTIADDQNEERIAIIGTTGILGRAAIQNLSSRSIQTKCLLRHPISPSTTPSIEPTASSTEVAAYLATLPNVEMVQGDVNDVNSLVTLFGGCTSVLALHGATAPNPIIKGLIPILYRETNPSHPKMVNYHGVKNIIHAATEENSSIRRIIRITGKGETPFSFFSIVLNMLSGMAKGWNYEGEQLLRTQPHTPNRKVVDYTIVRPGIMQTKDMGDEVLGLKDNGGDMKVTPISYDQIADLCIESLKYDNCARSTLTAMNVDEGMGEREYGILLKGVKEDSRSFPVSLIQEHKRGARIGTTILVVLLTVVGKSLQLILGKLW